MVIEKSTPLKGVVRISGAKNSALPILVASLLADGETVIEEVPILKDVSVICELIRHLGAEVILDGEREKAIIRTDGIKVFETPHHLVKQMRASILSMGVLLARCGKVRISMPGGCAIGIRPIDLHLKGFQKLGAEINLGCGFVEASCRKLRGNNIYLDFPSVGATENIMMAAVLADGETVIENAAEEPEIVDLANFLNEMGAKISGAGTKIIKIEGVKNLNPCNHIIIPDRIEAGTYMVASAITGGDVIIENVIPCHLRPITAKLLEAGMMVEEYENSIRVQGKKPINPVDIKTMPYPGFPTDMQPQMMSMLCIASGTSIVTETVFENRFMHVGELKRMGARIKIEGRSAVIDGIESLSGAPVKATDLRAGAALVLAGLIADGYTEVYDVHHIDRGYVKMVEKLKNLGAKIWREEA